MARKRPITAAGRRFLDGPRYRRGPRARPKPPVEKLPNVIHEGRELNEPESMIYRALVKLNIRFEPQYLVGNGRALGGAMLDFFLPDYMCDLDYRGPFHRGDLGEARDFWRDAERQLRGIRRIWIEYEDVYASYLPRRILELIGNVELASVVTR